MKLHNTNKNHTGFTLVEMVIVVAIVGILAAVALPSYFEQVRKARRSDVMDTMMACAAAQTRNYTTSSPPSYMSPNGARDSGFCGTATGADGVTTSGDGYYTLTMANNNCQVGNSLWCFSITAVPVAGQSQARDLECQFFTLNHTGFKAASDIPGDPVNPAPIPAANDTTARCWRT